MTGSNPFAARSQLVLADGNAGTFFRLGALEEAGLTKLARLPFSIRVLLESALRNHNGFSVRDEDVRNIAGWRPQADRSEIPFIPARVILQDFTGVPAVVDIAACRNAIVELGGDPARVNPAVEVDLVIDHSVQVDIDGRHADSLLRNLDIEYRRNAERYEFLKWGQRNLDNFRAVPPGRGIVHQVNLEWIATVAHMREIDGERVYFPDSLVGTDSHTTMINGLGVLGWGVGGIEAEAVMLGQPVYMLAPDVVGFKLSGQLTTGVTATDMTLRIVEMLRKHGVVGKFVEFYGPGLDSLSLADRATIANMAPEYGATCGYFPVDQRTLEYLQLSGRPASHVANVETYFRAQGLFRTADTPDPEFSETLELDLAEVETSLAGPKRPQDRVALSAMKTHFRGSLTAKLGLHGHGLAEARVNDDVAVDGHDWRLAHGDVVIAAITSCTNTSNPAVMLAAGLLARNARARGLTSRPWVKTSLAPGSRVVSEYFERAGLDRALAELGFNVVGYGCTTCIGNSGPLPPEIETAIRSGDLVVGSVLSGNRNFEGRVHNQVKASYLASPPLVVAYALAGTLDIDFEHDALGTDSSGQPVYLKELWPADAEIRQAMTEHIDPTMFRERYADITEEPRWDAIEVVDEALYPWNAESTYIRQPPFFRGMTADAAKVGSVEGARVLLLLGDSVTTDHISPAGSFPEDSPAGRYLLELGVPKAAFNSYGSRRGNHEVMMRGTFANVRIRNQIAPGTEGGWTKHWPTGAIESVFDAAMQYAASGTPLVVLAGSQYGTGSSRDWAAKGTALLGVKAVITKSFERIHRSNLVGMGVLPLCFAEGEGVEALGLDGSESFDIPLTDELEAGQDIVVTATRTDGSTLQFTTTLRLDTPVEVEYYRNGGILHTVLRKMAASDAGA
ncbi:MAG: aconitate hydratase AcnA [Myxococcales bacterium FL481]|nr:MAG: aconitate hydratase AcnA [Myxococcales bacterium FL481]